MYVFPLHFIQLYVLPFLCISVIFYTIYSAWWWRKVRSKHFAIIKYTNAQLCSVSLHNYYLKQSGRLKFKLKERKNLHKFSTSWFYLISNKLCILCAYLWTDRDSLINKDRIILGNIYRGKCSLSENIYLGYDTIYNCD